MEEEKKDQPVANHTIPAGGVAGGEKKEGEKKTDNAPQNTSATK